MTGRPVHRGVAAPGDGRARAAGPLRHLTTDLADLASAGLLRSPPGAGPGEPVPRGDGGLVLCSNDYLGLAAEPWPADDFAPGGAGASRLVSGEHPAHALAERAIAGWVGTQAALLFSSGYAANVGVLAALARPGDLIVSDALNHASIVDGCRLSRARVVVVPHLDLAAAALALAAAPPPARRWLVTESYFSMDGHVPGLAALRDLCDRHDAALIVDEAHAVGVFGPAGAGLCAEAGVTPDVLVGTLGKAVGLHGAFVAGSLELRHWLWNRARSFVFSTGVSPRLAGAAVARIARVRRADAERVRLEVLGGAMRRGLAELGATIVSERGPVLPWVVGDAAAALRASALLADHGVYVQAIRPPTVPAGGSRLRVTLSASLCDSDVARALAAFARAVRAAP